LEIGDLRTYLTLEGQTGDRGNHLFGYRVNDRFKKIQKHSREEIVGEDLTF